MTPKEKQRRAFDNIYDRFPLFASFAAQWKITWTNRVPYAATNGPELFLNPEFVETLKIAEVTDLILHELAHVFYGHMNRFPGLIGKDEDGKRASALAHQELNIAADLAVNDNMLSHYDQTPNSKIVEIAIFPGRRHLLAGDKFLNFPKGKDAEHYYELTKKSRTEEPPQQPQRGKGLPPQEGAGEGTPDEPDEAEGEEGGADGADGKNQESEDSQNQQAMSGAGESENSDEEDEEEAGSESEGAQASQNGNESEDALSDIYDNNEYRRSDLPESLGDVLPHPVFADPDATEEQMEEVEREWQKKVAQGINNAKMQGDLPGWLEELAEQLYGKKSEQNWRALLRRFMTRVVSHGGQTYERPNRRHSYREDIIIPANRSRQASKGCVLVDTSGSMSTKQCNAALAEIEAILRTFPRSEVDLVMADTRLIDRNKKTFHHYDFPLRLPMEWLGRGGTDLCAPILGVADDRSYKWLVVITDCYWSVASAKNPKIPTIWCWTPEGGEKQPYQRPTFGTLIGPIETSQGR